MSDKPKFCTPYLHYSAPSDNGCACGKLLNAGATASEVGATESAHNSSSFSAPRVTTGEEHEPSFMGAKKPLGIPFFEKNGLRVGERVAHEYYPTKPGTVIYCAEDGVQVLWDDGQVGDMAWDLTVAYDAYRLQVIRQSRALTESSALPLICAACGRRNCVGNAVSCADAQIVAMQGESSAVPRAEPVERQENDDQGLLGGAAKGGL